MKKAILIGMTVLTLCGAGMAAASNNGDALSREEKQIMVMMSGLQGKNYDSVTPVMASSLKTKLTPAVYAGMQKTLRQQFSNQTEMRLVSVEKYDQGDRLTYLLAYGQGQQARVVFTVGPNGQDGLHDFTIAPVTIKPADQK